MIKQQELSKIAHRENVREQQIQKDYVISWILWGISKDKILSKVLIFKGGTCLKKMYFEDYRYSEDMDFTMNPDNTLDTSIYQGFEEVFAKIEETTTMKFSIVEDTKGVHPSTESLHFEIHYIGPLGGNGDKVKVDITRKEILEFDTEQKTILHEYSDLKEEEKESEKTTVQCYSLNEVLIEKMAALMGRTVPRDLYDFEYLTNQHGMDLEDVLLEFERKAKNKGQNPNDFSKKVLSKEKSLKTAWENNLKHQIKDLSKFDDAWNQVKKVLRKFDKINLK